MDATSICTPDIDFMECRQFKKEATLDKTAAEITDADWLVAEKLIVTCGLRSNMDSFTVTCPFWVLVASRKGEETLLVPFMVSISWHTRNTWEYTGKKGGFGRKGYVACTGGYESTMHNACIGGVGNTSSLPIVMINVVFENTPFWALGVYGIMTVYSRLQYLSIRPYTLEYTAVYGGYLFAPGGCFKLKNSIVVPFVPILLHALPLPNNCTPLETNLGSYFTHCCNVRLHMCPFQSILCCFLLSQAFFFLHHD